MKFLKPLYLILMFGLLGACNGTTNTTESMKSPTQTIKLLTETRTTQYFTDQYVTIDDMRSILDAGHCASSGRNKQNWYFGAIINPEIIKQIGSTMSTRKAPHAKEQVSTDTKKIAKAQFSDAPAIIALASNSSNFSLGLACQNMVVAAAALGYGTKIVMTGTDQLNETANRELLNIPDNMKVCVIIYVGVEDTSVCDGIDGVTGASSRQSLEKVSTIIQ